MKKKVLAALMIGASILALTGCSSLKQKQFDEQFMSDIEALPADVIEDESESDTKAESQEEHELEEGEWVTAYTKEDEDPNDKNIYFENIQTIRRDFPLNDRGATFGELSDICAKYDMHFSADAFNDIFAINYIFEDGYAQTYAKFAEEETITVVSRMYMIACFMGANQLNINSAIRLYTDTDNYVTYYCTDPQGNEFEVTWDMPTGNLTAYAPSTGNSMDAGMNLNDKTILLTYSMEVREGYKVGQEKQSVDGYFQQKEGKAQEEQGSNDKTVTADGSSLSGYKFLAEKEAEVVKAIEDYYGSTIATVKDKGYDTSEGAYITMENGKKCSYYGTADMVTITDDVTYEYIWKSE